MHKHNRILIHKIFRSKSQIFSKNHQELIIAKLTKSPSFLHQFARFQLQWIHSIINNNCLWHLDCKDHKIVTVQPHLIHGKLELWTIGVEAIETEHHIIVPIAGTVTVYANRAPFPSITPLPQQVRPEFDSSVSLNCCVRGVGLVAQSIVLVSELKMIERRLRYLNSKVRRKTLTHMILEIQEVLV